MKSRRTISGLSAFPIISEHNQQRDGWICHLHAEKGAETGPPHPSFTKCFADLFTSQNLRLRYLEYDNNTPHDAGSFPKELKAPEFSGRSYLLAMYIAGLSATLQKPLPEWTLFTGDLYLPVGVRDAFQIKPIEGLQEKILLALGLVPSGQKFETGLKTALQNASAKDKRSYEENLASYEHRTRPGHVTVFFAPGEIELSDCDFPPQVRLSPKLLTYKEIQAWVAKSYGINNTSHESRGGSNDFDRTMLLVSCDHTREVAECLGLTDTSLKSKDDTLKCFEFQIHRTAIVANPASTNGPKLIAEPLQTFTLTIHRSDGVPILFEFHRLSVTKESFCLMLSDCVSHEQYSVLPISVLMSRLGKQTPVSTSPQDALLWLYEFQRQICKNECIARPPEDFEWSGSVSDEELINPKLSNHLERTPQPVGSASRTLGARKLLRNSAGFFNLLGNGPELLAHEPWRSAGFALDEVPLTPLNRDALPIRFVVNNPVTFRPCLVFQSGDSAVRLFNIINRSVSVP